MCFDFRDAKYAKVCKERDELRQENEKLKEICEKQVRMNRKAAEMALKLDTVTADRNRLQEAYDAMSRDLEKMSARVNESQNELAKVKAERDAAVLDLRTSSGCWHCGKNGKTCHMIEPVERPEFACGGYVWQGMEGK